METAVQKDDEKPRKKKKFGRLGRWLHRLRESLSTSSLTPTRIDLDSANSGSYSLSAELIRPRSISIQRPSHLDHAIIDLPPIRHSRSHGNRLIPPPQNTPTIGNAPGRSGPSCLPAFPSSANPAFRPRSNCFTHSLPCLLKNESLDSPPELNAVWSRTTV